MVIFYPGCYNANIWSAAAPKYLLEKLYKM